jgi:hypothetical protein
MGWESKRMQEIEGGLGEGSEEDREALLRCGVVGNRGTGSK